MCINRALNLILYPFCYSRWAFIAPSSLATTNSYHNNAQAQTKPRYTWKCSLLPYYRYTTGLSQYSIRWHKLCILLSHFQWYRKCVGCVVIKVFTVHVVVSFCACVSTIWVNRIFTIYMKKLIKIFVTIYSTWLVKQITLMVKTCCSRKSFQRLLFFKESEKSFVSIKFN